jgi:hypothetical protein
MNIWDIIVGGLVVLLLLFALRLARDRKKNGGCCSSGCDGNCSACSGCPHKEHK